MNEHISLSDSNWILVVERTYLTYITLNIFDIFVYETWSDWRVATKYPTPNNQHFMQINKIQAVCILCGRRFDVNRRWQVTGRHFSIPTRSNGKAHGFTFWHSDCFHWCLTQNLYKVKAAYEHNLIFTFDVRKTVLRIKSWLFYFLIKFYSARLIHRKQSFSSHIFINLSNAIP